MQKSSEQVSPGQWLSDTLAKVMGSWQFIIFQSIILLSWIIANTIAIIHHHWDPYPFILLNLALSFQAAYSAPIIMMSQNRQATKDRQMAEEDYAIDMKAEKEIESILAQLEKQGTAIQEILDFLKKKNNKSILTK